MDIERNISRRALLKGAAATFGLGVLGYSCEKTKPPATTEQATATPETSPGPTARPVTIEAATPQSVVVESDSVKIRVVVRREQKETDSAKTEADSSKLSGETLGGANWSVSGAPERATPEKVANMNISVSEGGQTRTIEGLEFIAAEPGVLTTEDCVKADESVSALCSLRPNVQKTFESNPPAFWLIGEGDPKEGRAYLMLTGAQIELKLPDGVTINAERGGEDHSWLILLRGKMGDGTTPGDGNLRVEISDYDAGSTMATRLPAGQYVSADYLEQNVNAAHGKECGNDGCKVVSVLAYDVETGALTVGSHSKETGWKTEFTNWK